jgi:hypothetical protein
MSFRLQVAPQTYKLQVELTKRSQLFQPIWKRTGQLIVEDIQLMQVRQGPDA